MTGIKITMTVECSTPRCENKTETSVSSPEILAMDLESMRKEGWNIDFATGSVICPGCMEKMKESSYISKDKPKDEMRRCRIKNSDVVHLFDPVRKKTLCDKKYSAFKMTVTTKPADCPKCLERSK
jgi:hypothetical protein